MLRVDAHVHFWNPAAVPIDWLVQVPKLNRPFLPADLLRDQQPPADAWVFVEAGARDALAEVSWVHSQAQTEARLRAIVAALPLLDDHERLRLLAAYRNMPLVRGVRWSLIGMSAGLLRSDRLRAALEDVQTAGLTFDLNIESTQLDEAVRLASHLPKLGLALDHGGNPDIAPDAFPTWADALARLAACPNVVCKLSGLVTRPAADRSLAATNLDDLKPWVYHIIACFGPRRVMIGSDFPIITQNAACAQWTAFLERELEAYTAEEQTDLWANTARRFYRLDIPASGSSSQSI
jgi:L-fuconolactonase